MKSGILLTLVALSLSTSVALGQDVPSMNDPVKYPRQVISNPPDSIDGKPISYYLNHPQIDRYSKLYVQAKFSVSDNNPTFAMMDSIETKNPETRPFYLFVFHRIMDKTDGALSEAVAGNCDNYFKKNTCDFFALIKHGEYSSYEQQWLSYFEFSVLWSSKNKVEVIMKLRENLARNCAGKYSKDLDEIIARIDNAKQ